MNTIPPKTDPVAKPVKPEKVKKPEVTMVQKIKGQLGVAVLKNKISIEELTALEEHIKKLQAVLS